MGKPIFEAKRASTFGDFGRFWKCVIPVDKKTELNAAEPADLLRSDFWSQMVNAHHVVPGDVIFAEAVDHSFFAMLLIRGVDDRNLRVVVTPLTSGDFRDAPILIGKEIIIQKAGKAWSVSKKITAGTLELVKGGFAGSAEARGWTERMGAVDIVTVGEDAEAAA